MQKGTRRGSAFFPCFLAFVFLLTSFMFPSPGYALDYGKTTAEGVRVRQQPSANASYWFRLAIDTVCPYTQTVTNEGVTWYQISASDPATGDGPYTGYVHGDYFRPLSSEEASQYAVGSLTPTVVSGATGMVTNGEVNVRKEASTRSPSLMKLDRGVVVELLTIPASSDQDPWYRIQYNNVVGYIQGPFIRVVSYGSMTPNPAQPTSAGNSVYPSVPGSVGTATLILSSAHLRSTPGGVIYEDWEGTGATLPVVGQAVEAQGYTWYPLQYKNRTVYVRSDCVSVTFTGTVTAAPTNAPGIVTPVPTAAPVPTAVPASSETISGYLETIKTNVNLRAEPAGRVIKQVAKGLQLAYWGTPASVGGYLWYHVEVDGETGYLRSDCIRVTSTVSGATAAPVPVTSAPTAAPVVTQAPSPATAAPVVTEAPAVGGYLTTTKSGVNLRAEPAGNVLQQVGKNVSLAYYGSPASVKGYLWYRVQVGTVQGYLRGDCVRVESGSAVSTPTPAPTSEPVVTPSATATPVPSSGTIRIIKDKVALRTAASPDARIADRVNTGVTILFTGTTTGGGYTWYHVVYRSREYYVRSDCAQIVSGDDVVTTPTPAGATATPAPTGQQTVLGYVRTIKGGVNVRTEPGSRNILGQVARGITYPYYAKVSSGGYVWYRVITAVGTGYIRGDCALEVEQNGNELPVATPNSGSSSIVSTDQVEATYPTLKVGSTGTAVKNLVQELINQGYYAGLATPDYTSAVAEAVRSFQAAKGLTADGVADERTQHTLFGTASVGSADYTDLSMVIYPAEKIDWFTGGIQELIPRGSNFKIYDVKTGIVWWAHRWAGGNHADIETLTAADTARLCRIYGVSRASDITERTHWQRRPCLVTIGTRTFACALYGVPHNSDGDTIADNNLTGQLCLHFTNSRTHGSNKVVSYNEEAIEYAWQYAPNGHK